MKLHLGMAAEFGIALDRMTAKRASFMAPIASNIREERRELNRRVKLVLKRED